MDDFNFDQFSDIVKDNFYKDDFEIEKIERSHAHQVRGRANKRRYIVIYLRKK